MEKLFQNASWMHPEYSDSSSNFYNFDSFWEPPIGPTPAPLIRRKRKHPSAASAPSNPNHTSASADFTSDSVSNGVTQNDNTGSVSAAMTSINTHSMVSSAKEPVSGAKGDPVSGCEGANAPPNIISPAVSAPLPKPKVEYSIYKGSIPSQQFMAEHDLACNVYTVHPDHVPPTQDIPYSPDSFPTAPHVFSTYLSAYLALDNKEDVLTQSHMLKAADMDKFLTSQVPEIRGLEAMNVFQYKPMHSLPARAHLLSSIWSYRRKRKPNGELLKYKARICVDGSQQAYGRDYWDTYAPVVTWSTVRLVLLLSTILNLKSRQVDYTQAFPQADLVDPVYMHLPQGWHITPQGTLAPHTNPKHNDKTHYIQLLKNLYGCKQAARNWFQHLDAGLKAQGFRQSSTDPCLYLRKDCIMVVYTDDCLIFAPSDAIIDTLVSNLSELYKLEDQGDVHVYVLRKTLIKRLSE
jgi:hypothetical protein